MRVRANIFQLFMHCILLPICLGLFTMIALSFFLNYEKAILFAFLLAILAFFFQMFRFIFSLSLESETLSLQKLGKSYQFSLQDIQIETEILVTNLIFKEQKIKIKALEEEYEFDLSLMSFFKFRELQNILKNNK